MLNKEQQAKLDELTCAFNDTYYINLVTRAFIAGCEITQQVIMEALNDRRD